MEKYFMQALEILWKGMLATFIAITILFFGIVILNHITRPKEQNEESKNNEE